MFSTGIICMEEYQTFVKINNKGKIFIIYKINTLSEFNAIIKAAISNLENTEAYNYRTYNVV